MVFPFLVRRRGGFLFHATLLYFVAAGDLSLAGRRGDNPGSVAEAHAAAPFIRDRPQPIHRGHRMDGVGESLRLV